MLAERSGESKDALVLHAAETSCFFLRFLLEVASSHPVGGSERHVRCTHKGERKKDGFVYFCPLSPDHYEPSTTTRSFSRSWVYTFDVCVFCSFPWNRWSIHAEMDLFHPGNKSGLCTTQTLNLLSYVAGLLVSSGEI